MLLVEMSTTGQSVSILKLISQIKKCSSSQSLYKLLVQIRTDVIREDEGIKLLRDSGGLKHIVKFLSKPNEKVLNVSLSILANCCLQEDCREQVGYEMTSPCFCTGTVVTYNKICCFPLKHSYR